MSTDPTIDEIIEAIKTIFQQRVTDLELQIKIITNKIADREKQIVAVTSQLNELTAAQDQDEDSLKNMEKQLKDYQKTLDDINTGKIDIKIKK